METILDSLKRNLRAAGPALWEAIAAEAGVAKTLPRKLVYGDRENLGMQTAQVLIDYFAAIERGERKLPIPPRDADASASEAAAQNEG